MSTRDSQRARMLERLRGGEWVPSVELAQISLQYCARVAELRQLGYVIVNRTERQDDGRIFGYFRLEGELPALTNTANLPDTPIANLPDMPIAFEPVEATPKPPQTVTGQGELFGDLTPRHKDLG